MKLYFMFLLAVALVGALYPKSFGSLTLIMPKKILSIQTSKNDPPRIAFEIINRKKSKIELDWKSIETKPAVSLVSGYQAPVSTLYSRKVVMQPMVIEKANLPVAEIQSTTLQADNREWMEGLSQQQRRRIEEAQFRSGTLEQDWSEPSFQQRAAKIIKEVEENESRKPAGTIVAGTDESGKYRDQIEKSSVEVREQKDSKVTGIIELKGLPPPTDNQWQFHIARYDNGVKVEDASFDMKTSKYAIDVADLDGSVVAQLVDSRSGNVVGEGKLRLSEYAKNKNGKITVQKVNNYFAANFPNFYDHPSVMRQPRFSQHSKPTEVHLASLDLNGATNKEGLYNFDQIQNRSWALVRAQRSGFSEGLYLAQAGVENSLTLMPEKMMNALRNIVSEQNLSSEVAPTGSVVWGQITQSDRPMSGVTLQIEGLPDYKPIYLNKFMIPDSQQTVTSENGYFAFLDVPAGFQTVTASIGVLNLSHFNVVVDDNSVSIANIESFMDMSDVGLKVYDAFSGNAQSATLDLQSLPDSLNVTGYAKIKLPNTSRLSLLQVNPAEPQYSPSLHLYNDADDALNVPLIRTEWIQAIVNQKRLNLIPQKGTIVGFVHEWEYQVYLGHESEFSKENIVYFDAQGQVSETGVPGGGFIIVNVPVGVQSIVITDNKSDMIHTQVAPVDDSALVTVKY